MLQVNLPVVYTIHSKGNELVTGVKIKATGESKLNDNPDSFQYNKKRMGCSSEILKKNPQWVLRSCLVGVA